jgi:DNA polymerase-1
VLRELLRGFNIVVPLGNTALQFMFGTGKISQWRGSVLQTDGVKVLPTYHPAFVMRNQDFIPVVILDLAKAARNSLTRDYTKPRQNYVTSSHSGAVLEIGQHPAFALDVETNSLQAHANSVTMCGLAAAPGESRVIRDVHDPLNREALRRLFASDKLKIGHNVGFDIEHMEANGVPVAWPWYDTMIAHHLILSDVPNDLEFVTSIYTNIPPWKHTMKEDLTWYNATDVDATFRIYQETAPELRLKGLDKVFETSMRVIPVLRKMTKTGVLVDTQTQAKWRVGLEMIIKKKEKALAEALQDPLFNWRSPVQLSKLLYQKLGYKSVVNRKTGSVTTGAAVLQELYEERPNPILRLLLELRKASKLASTYFERPPGDDGRMHTDFLLHGTATGRLSSRNPNLQNVPKGIARSIYVPSPGFVFVQADYSQIEMRIMAYLAGEQVLLEAFDRGYDIHKFIASKVYKCPIEEVDPKQRFKAKTIVYGLNYGRGALSLAKAYKMTKTEADTFILGYFSQFPRIKQWREKIVSEGNSQGYLVNPFGRRRYFFGMNETPKMYNFIPQSSGADVLFLALLRLESNLPKHSRQVLTVHDSILIECPEDKVEEVTTCIRDCMEAPIDCLPKFKVPVTVSSGKTWGACDE